MRISLEIMLLCAVLFIPSTFAENIPVYNEIPLNYPWTGYMGEYNGNSALNIDTTWPIQSESGMYCARISYDRTKEQWAGLFIQGDGTWNRGPRIGLNLAGARKLVFYAKGSVGLENVKFGYGYDSSDQSRFTDSSYGSRMISLTTEWQKYEFDLAGKDLSHINGLFMFSVDKFNNPNSVIFYLDNITYI